MEYQCIDRGGASCPCHLMAVGQCYTCTMLRGDRGSRRSQNDERMTGERCSCGVNWQGICPYTEYLQQGEQAVKQPDFEALPIIGQRDYSEQLTVVRLQTGRGFAQKCHRLGTYIMVRSLGYEIPLSVLRSQHTGPDAYIEVAIQPAGPKSVSLLDDGSGYWRVKGPFYGGLSNVEYFEGRGDGPLLVIGKGTALAPYFNVMDVLENEQPEGVQLLVDDDKLTDAFLEEYLGGRTYQPVRLQTEADALWELADLCRRVMVLASPYYVEQLLQRLPGRTKEIVVPNHANLCCGLGICGACSHTDADGRTVRRCKCPDNF